MTSPSIVDETREQLEQLLKMVNYCAEKGVSTAYQVEHDLFDGVLKIGQLLLQQYFNLCSQLEEEQTFIEKAGECYQSAGQPSRKYRSVFGEVKAERNYYWKAGHGGLHPLDAKLSLPEEIYSDWVQELVVKRATEMPYEKALQQLGELLPVDMSKRTAKQTTLKHATDVTAYYAQASVQEAIVGDTILVATADGKGIPMIAKDSPAPENRREKGRKTAKKSATVVATYTVAPYYRDTETLIASLLRPDTSSLSSIPTRPKPHNKHVFATLEGQQAAFTSLEKLLKQRDTDHVIHRVALTDGDHGLHNRVAAQLPDFTLVMDIMHVLGYLWNAVGVFFKPGHPLRYLWMEMALRCLFEDNIEKLCHVLRVQSEASCFTNSQRKTLCTTLTYLENNCAYMDYQTYLSLGFPIGSGVIEGTCRYFIHDRFERSGMRWSRKGAEAMLQLRAVVLNEDWDDFQKFRHQQTHQRIYGSTHPALLPELAACQIAA
jgi:hypothetical protein